MINFGSFPFSEEAKQKINLSVQNYWRFARIEVKGGPGYNAEGEEILSIHLTQKELVNNKILTEDELIVRGTEIFGQDQYIVPVGQKIEVTATPYMP